MRRRLSCPYLADLRARWDGELAEPRAASLEGHMSSCPICQAEQRALEALSRALRTGDAEGSVPRVEHERLKSALLKRCASSLAGTQTQVALPACSPPAPAPRTISLGTAAAIAACCAILAVLLFPVFHQARERARSYAPASQIANADRGNADIPGLVSRSDTPAQMGRAAVAPPSPAPPEEPVYNQLPPSEGVSMPALRRLARTPRPPGDVLGMYAPAMDGHMQDADEAERRSHVAGKPSASQARGAAATYQPNAYLSNTYIGGTGSRDRLEKLIENGVVVQGRRVRLEAFGHSYDPGFPIPSRTALNLIAGTERTKIVQQGDHTYLQVGLQAMKGEMPRRPPLNLGLVIDCSGSMGDEQKLDFAKEAALRLVDELRPDDVLALVAFDDTARLLVPAAKLHDRARVKAQIAALTPGSGTNIYQGLQLGYREARKFATPDEVNRVILLSDGEVTAGVSDPHQFETLVSAAAANDLQTTTVGMGVDFDEELMLDIARQGQGNYHFLRDAADTQRVFAQELNELTHVVAKAIRLRIRLADGVGLMRVLGAATLDAEATRQVKAQEKQIDRKVADELGIPSNRQRQRDEPGLKLLIPSFYRGDHHVVMLELALPPGRGRRKVADVYLKYKDLVGRANREAQSTVAVDYTSSRTEMIASIDRGVKKNLLGFETGEALTQAASMIQQGKIAEAVRKIDERMVVLGVAAREWSDRDLDRDGQLLDRYKMVLSQLHRQPQLASGDLGQYLKKSLTYAGYNLTR